MERMADNTGISPAIWRYPALKLMLNQWRHLHMLKRGGRGHDPSPNWITETKDGELAVRCPSCPRPGVNLDGDYIFAAPENQYLYRAMLAMDANFRLKNQLVSSWSRDPGMGIGTAYFVARPGLEAYVKSRMHEDDISTCAGFAALTKAATKYSRGLRYTGVGAVSCARTDMITTVANLEKGERYANMDYAMGVTLRDFVDVDDVLICYDIACQWFKNLHHRMEKLWPKDISPGRSLALSPAIGKFHEPAHGQKDHEEFSLNLIPGVGKTEGEGQERVWGVHNCLSAPTKPMAPAARILVLDDNFGFWNWLKYCGHGRLLRKRLTQAESEVKVQVESHEGWTARLPRELVEEWEDLIVAWEQAPFPKKNTEGLVNPFAVPNEFLTEDQAFAELEAEDRVLTGAENTEKSSFPSAPAFISMGISLVDEQYQLAKFVKEEKNNGSSDSETLNERRAILQEKIDIYERVRSVYMPGLLQMLVEMASQHSATGPEVQVSSSDQTVAEAIRLWLPSEIDQSKRAVVCITRLPEIEDRLRTARCQDALHNIQHTLRVKSRMMAFKNKNIKGQRENLRSRAVIDRVTARMKEYARLYRENRQAKLKLLGPGKWEEILRVLNDADMTSYRDQARLKAKPGRHGANEDSWEPSRQETGSSNGVSAGVDEIPEHDEGNIDLRTVVRTGIHEHPGRKAGEVAPRWEGTGESTKVLSWIWTAGIATSLEDGADDGNQILRAEWCRSRARMWRSKEELNLVKEEMRRTSLSLLSKAAWWDARSEMRVTSDLALQEGLVAYAKKQASLQRGLNTSFVKLWDTPSEKAREEERAEEARKLALHSETGPGDGEDSDSDDGGDSEDEGLWDGEVEEENREEEEREVEDLDAGMDEEGV